MQATILMASNSLKTNAMKFVWILRHGQATHNPRAEAAKDRGCSHDEFMRLMEEDDSVDSPLTKLGEQQAEQVQAKHGHLLRDLELVVCSPLSRALSTADAGMPSSGNRIVLEDLREINGKLLNAQRLSRTELGSKFIDWNFDDLQSEHDTWWTPKLESQQDCRERGYQSLCWIIDRPEKCIGIVGHGGILRYTMQDHELVQVEDERTNRGERLASDRFGNCDEF